MSDSNRQSSGAGCASFFRFVGGATLLMAAATASAQSVVVQARGTLAANVGPVMQLRINNTLVGAVEVRSAVFTDYAFDTGAVPTGAKVEVIFNNDTCCASGDRNLYVQAIRLNGAVVTPTDPGVLFEPGSGDAALDGTGTRSGLSGMLWNGALRFYAPAISSGPTYYFSDCQTGAATGCLPGSNANPGTQAAPKQNLAGIDVNALPAGSRLLFARGGAWNMPLTFLENMNASAAAPLTFDAYGTGVRPTFQTVSGDMFYLGGGWENTSNDGGYVFRNIKFDGRGTANWGFWFSQTVRDVIIEDSELTGFGIAINSNDGPTHGVTGITMRRNHIHHNSDMGLLGHYNNFLFEDNLVEANNFSGSGFSHGTYIGGGNNITVRNNRYLRNSVVNGVCQGGNMTFHGQIDGLLIEGNRIEQDAAAGGCWLMSITTGYTTPEWFLNTVVRNNKLINGGNSSLVAQAAPGIVVEGNVAINTRATYQVGFNVGGGVGAGDTLDANAVVRNNTACQSGGATGSVVSVNSPGATVTNNVVVTGAAATTGVCAR